MVLIDISPLKYREFRFLFLGQLISMLGSQMTMVSVPFQVYALTKSTFQTGLISAIELICLVSTALFGGAVADKFDRRKIIIGSEIILMFLIGALAINAMTAAPSLWLIYVLAGLCAAVNGFHRPAFEALTPLLVPKTELSKLSSLMSCKYVAASLIGPTAGGILVASIGPAFTYLVDFFTFVISLLLLLRIATAHLQPLPEERGERASMLNEIAMGGHYIWQRKDILGSYVIDFIAMVFCMPQVLFPAFANHYGVNRWLGFLYASVAVGAMMATLASRWTTKVKGLGRAIFFAACGWALSIFLAGVAYSFFGLILGLFLAGACDSYSGIFRTTMWNESIPSNYRGRLASFGMLSYMSGPLLGNTLMGFLGDLIGLHQALLLGSSLSLLVMGMISFALPAFFRYRSPGELHYLN